VKRDRGPTDIDSFEWLGEETDMRSLIGRSHALALGLALAAVTLSANDARADEPVAAPAPAPAASPADNATDEANYMRLRHLVSDGAQFEYASTAWRGVYGMVLGAGIGGFSAYAYTQAHETPSKTAGVLGMVLGGVLFVGGTLTLALNHGGALANIDANQSQNSESSAARRLSVLEDDLRRAAERDRGARRASGYVGIIFGGILIIGTTIFFAVDDKDSKTFRNAVAGVGWLAGTGSIFQGIAALGWQRTHVENTYNAWRRIKEESPTKSAFAPPPPTAVVSTPAIRF
jgi:hypothetical protein